MNMNGDQLGIWLVVGMIPYHIEWQSMKDGRMLEIRALFWLLVGDMRPGERFVWALHIPLIKHLGNVARAVLVHLRREEDARK